MDKQVLGFQVTFKDGETLKTTTGIGTQAQPVLQNLFGGEYKDYPRKVSKIEKKWISTISEIHSIHPGNNTTKINNPSYSLLCWVTLIIFNTRRRELAQNSESIS